MNKNSKVNWDSLLTSKKGFWLLASLAIIGVAASYYFNFFPISNRYNNAVSGIEQFRNKIELTQESNGFYEIGNILVEQVNKDGDKIAVKDITSIKCDIPTSVSGGSFKPTYRFDLTLMSGDKESAKISFREDELFELANEKYVVNQIVKANFWLSIYLIAVILVGAIRENRQSECSKREQGQIL
jgi:hypothetical protein